LVPLSRFLPRLYHPTISPPAYSLLLCSCSCYPLAPRTQLKFLSYNQDFWAQRKKLAAEKRIVDEI
jgi:hypothetical protein